VAVHTIGVSQAYPADRSLRSVGLTGSAVAHQPFRLEIEVGCEPSAACDEAEVRVKELLERQEPQVLSTGRAKFEQGRALLSLELTLEQAGNRALLIELTSATPDDVVQNDRRIVPVFVRRDRLRMLHVAGRPTYDVRALRKFLKSDESIDLVSFFILRTESDQVQAEQEELALIPFPVDELFSEHLSSFDAIILQDIDAPRYRLDRYFGALRDYVVRGGGLILVGGPTGFSSGGYAGSPLEEVLPVYLPREGELIVRKAFVPQFTEAGRVAPILKPLRSTMGEELPEMSGANALGSARPGALVLWEHPSELARAGAMTQRMPVLAVYEQGDGRSVAISVDGSHQLRFGTVGAKTGGRAHADLWEGLLGWLMRDPRYESAQLRLDGECLAHRDQTLLVDPIP
ncbi:MAG TPA: glutamine amidotransferase, partial [Polyangiaceae bacterium]|nr:glutamine amidotransferase [Polyangiaceae bacterium]